MIQKSAANKNSQEWSTHWQEKESKIDIDPSNKSRVAGARNFVV